MNELIYMLTGWYPCNKAKNIMEATKSIPKVPSFIKKWQIFGTADGNNGYKTYNLIFIEENVSDEAAIFITKLQQHYVENVEGYTWKIEPVMSMKDSMKAML